MSFMTISAPGHLQDADMVRAERGLLLRVDHLVTALDRVLPKGVRFSDWIRFEEEEFHIDLQVDEPVQYHRLELAELLAHGARRIHNRNFAAFRCERAPERLEGDKAWLDANTAVFDVVSAGGVIRLLADTAHEMHLLAIDPEFVKQADTWDDGTISVVDAYLVGVKVIPTLTQGGMYSVLLSLEQSDPCFLATVPGDLLDVLRPGRIRVSFEYTRDDDGGCTVLLPTLLLRPTDDQRNLVICDVGT